MTYLSVVSFTTLSLAFSRAALFVTRSTFECNLYLNLHSQSQNNKTSNQLKRWDLRHVSTCAKFQQTQEGGKTALLMWWQFNNSCFSGVDKACQGGRSQLKTTIVVFANLKQISGTNLNRYRTGQFSCVICRVLAWVLWNTRHTWYL